MEACREARPAGERDPTVGLGDQTTRQQGDERRDDTGDDRADDPIGRPDGALPLELATTAWQGAHGDGAGVTSAEPAQQRRRPLLPPRGVGGEGEHVTGLGREALDDREGVNGHCPSSPQRQLTTKRKGRPRLRGNGLENS